MEKSLSQLHRENVMKLFETEMNSQLKRKQMDYSFNYEGMSARECISVGIAIYKEEEVKLYWSKEKCLSIISKLLRINKQFNEENYILAERTVEISLDKSNNR